MTTTLDVKRAIRDKYAWPGGYELYLVCSDGGVLCTACGRKEWRSIAYAMHHNLSDGWRVAGIGCTDTDESDVTCDHCGRTIYDPEDN
jgi:hypothetical protein